MIEEFLETISRLGDPEQRVALKKAKEDFDRKRTELLDLQKSLSDQLAGIQKSSTDAQALYRKLESKTKSVHDLLYSNRFYKLNDRDAGGARFNKKYAYI